MDELKMIMIAEAKRLAKRNDDIRECENWDEVRGNIRAIVMIYDAMAEIKIAD